MELMALAARASVIVLPTESTYSTVLFHTMISAMGWPMQMGQIGDLKDALGTIPDTPITKSMRELRTVRLQSVLLMVELMVRVTARCIIQYVNSLGTNDNLT